MKIIIKYGVPRIQQGSDVIISDFLTRVDNGEDYIQGWGNANIKLSVAGKAQGWNACAIRRRSNGIVEFWYYDERENIPGNPQWRRELNNIGKPWQEYP